MAGSGSGSGSGSDLYAQRVAAGVCRKCGVPRDRAPLTRGRKICERCLAKGKARCDARAEAGVCIRCQSPDVAEGTFHCRPCLDGLRDRALAWQARRRAEEGACRYCPGRADPGRKSCEKCRAKRRVWARENYHARRLAREDERNCDCNSGANLR